MRESYRPLPAELTRYTPARNGNPDGAASAFSLSVSHSGPDSEKLGTPSSPPVDALHAGPAGLVVAADAGTPMGGVRVQWVSGSPAAARDRGVRGGLVVLGETVTDAEGSFALALADTPAARASRCRLVTAQANAAEYVRVVEGDDLVAGPVPASDARGPLQLVIPGDAPAADVAWAPLAAFLEANRMYAVGDLQAQLAAPTADGPARRWPVRARAAALAALRDVLAAGAPPADADERVAVLQGSYVALDLLRTGRLRDAVGIFIDPGRRIELGPEWQPWKRAPKTELELYRDYLRAVWVTTAQQMQATPPSAPAPGFDAATLERLLDARFFQNFRTTDVAAQPTARLVSAVLRAALAADVARGGFGLAPAAIPAQGALDDDAHLRALVSASRVKATELRNRYRVPFDAPPDDARSPVQLNVDALLGLLADTFQTPREPFTALPPDAVTQSPLALGAALAPFFLQFEEWRARQERFYPENVFDPRRTAPTFHETERVRFRGLKTVPFPPNDVTASQGYFVSEFDYHRSAAWVERLFEIEDTLRAAFRQLDVLDHGGALETLQKCDAQLVQAAKEYDRTWVVDDFFWENSPGVWNDFANRRVTLKRRAAQRATSPDELRAVEAFFDPRDVFAQPSSRALARARSAGNYHVFYLRTVLLPYLRAGVAAARADYPTALRELTHLTGYPVGVAEPESPAGYQQAFGQPPYYQANSLPYTTLVGFDAELESYDDRAPDLLTSSRPPMDLSGAFQKLALAPFEVKFFKLVQADVMLAWADELYRDDGDASVRRARELYKGVLFVHGADPGIAPDFPRPGVLPVPISFGIDGLAPNPVAGDNPARRAQVARARLALFQIGEGLNVYGYRDDLVPILRYRPLKLAADTFAGSAKGAQSDYLAYYARFEQAQLDRWQAQLLATRASAAVGIAAERVELAAADVGKAQQQVAAVEAQIAAKRAEIADKGSLFSQFTDFMGGAKDSLTSLVPALQKADAADAPAPAGGGADGGILAGAGQGLTGAGGGAAGSGSAAGSALGAGGAALAGFGAFAYAGYTSMQGLGAAANRRDAELKVLETTTLDAARAQVRLREREARIARLEQTVAEAERAYAGDLLRFQRDRFLSAEFWQRLSALANQQMRRYVTLGARTAWMAERALAFEQARRLTVVRLNYLPAKLRGVTGADRLRADLAELEAARLDGVRLRVPVRHSVSVARDFPLAFGALKTTGRCRLRTLEAELRRLYPGTFAYRLRAVTAAADAAGGPVPRGVLRNGGVSLVGARDGAEAVLVRFPDALPLSEFRLRDDAAVYGLPDETLLQFEGSGFETDWELVLPAEANGPALRALVDVVLTFDLQAEYADGAVAPPVGAPGRILLLSASAGDPRGLRALRDPAVPARLVFDPRRAAPALREQNRRLANVGVLCLGGTGAAPTLAASLRAGAAGPAVDFAVANGVGSSNAGALLGGAAPLPLNALEDVPLDQPFTLEFERAGVQAELRHLLDVVLVLDYAAEPAP